MKATCPCKWSHSGEMSSEETQLASSLCTPAKPYLPPNPKTEPSLAAPMRDRKAGGGSLQSKTFHPLSCWREG